ncbi:MAG: flagellar hook-associated protein FlgK [Clostridia bacterium]
MGSSFFGLNIASRGLFVSQASLNVVNHNIANANTPGYSRQVATQKATGAMTTYNGTGMIGTGADITSVERVRNEYVDYKYWNENVSYGEWETKSTAVEELEGIFNEIDGNGSGKVLDAFFDALETLSKDPSSQQAREALKAQGNTTCKYLNATSEQLLKMKNDLNYAVDLKVGEINSISKQITVLNEQIYKSEVDGSHANDLRDQRTMLVDQLSKIVNIEAGEVVVGTLPNGQEDRHFQITLNGTYLVNHFNNYELECYEDADSMYQMKWKDSGNKVVPKSGELKGYMDMRDGNGTGGEYKGIPYYMDKLNQFARTFAEAFNEGTFADGESYYVGHAGGIGLDGSMGTRFFTYADGQTAKSSAEFMSGGSDMDDIYSHITAANISVSSDIMNSDDGIYKIATSSANGEDGNNENVIQLLELRNDTRMFAEGAPEDYMKSLVANLGVDAEQAQRMYTNQSNIVEQIDNRRLSISSVSISEEAANMIKYEQAYNAAAKMITVMDAIYDTTINRMGTSGR